MYTLRDIANLVQGQIIGDESLVVHALSPIENILPGTLVFADGEDNLKRAEASDAAAILVNQHYTHSQKSLIQVSNPYPAFIRLLHHFNFTPPVAPGIHPTAVIGQNVHIDESAYIGPYVVIESGSQIGAHCVLKSHIYVGHNVRVGAHCVFHPQVSIYDNSQIDEGVIIHASTVIGADGFGYAQMDGQQVKVPHIGHVHLEKNVEIGANTAVDRATLGATVIGEGTKIDNLVQIAHSVKLGKHNIVCGFTGIAGSTTSGDHVVFAANVGVADHVRIDDRVVLAARAGVPPKKHLRQDMVYLGSPARPKDVAIKQELATNRIPLMRKQIQRLTEQVASLTQQLEKLCENP